MFNYNGKSCLKLQMDNLINVNVDQKQYVNDVFCIKNCNG